MSCWFMYRCIDLLFTHSEVSQWLCVWMYVSLFIPCVSMLCVSVDWSILRVNTHTQLPSPPHTHTRTFFYFCLCKNFHYRWKSSPLTKNEAIIQIVILLKIITKIMEMYENQQTLSVIGRLCCRLCLSVCHRSSLLWHTCRGWKHAQTAESGLYS